MVPENRGLTAEWGYVLGFRLGRGKSARMFGTDELI